ncbi:zf-HC2 domain-containing protein [Cellulomonas sp. PhB150]|uniref:zf-HC2 domain-containing protein n=1 Tax=Cellulomonas sp. PhB150 TaxID=2485188 RepID=UPI000F4AE6EB|nr:zf-HC2 domain-containing protein [Cellulomonas sp. PhB150]ROS23094.1 putative zinc finger protein [Cellulomonas sp. PhB150]
MSHLGSRISALVDGQLAPAATERALAHVATCPECAAELSAARAARTALASACGDVSPDADFAARLLSLGPMQPPPVAPRSADPFAPPPRRTSHDVASYGLHRGRARRAWDSRTGAALCGEVPMRRVTSRLVVGSVAGMGAVAVMLFVLGERPAMAPEGQLSADLELLGHATAQPVSDGARDAASEADAADEPESWLARNGWPFPAELPAGWDVTDVRYTDGGALEVDVASPNGPVVVTEQPGRLDSERLVGAEQVTLEGRAVAVLSREPWHVVWQSGGTVVQVVAAQQSDGATELVAGFPGGAFDDGVPARISRGWSTVTGVFDQP